MAKKYVRFLQTKLRGEAKLIQLSAFDFYDIKDQKLKVKSVSNPEGINPDGNVPENVINGDTSNKWADMSKGALVFEFNKGVNVASYKFATANDCSERDPVRWSLEGSTDKKSWTLLDDRTKIDYETPEERNAYTQAILTEYRRDLEKKSSKKKQTKAKPGKRKQSTTRRASSKRKR